MIDPNTYGTNTGGATDAPLKSPPDSNKLTISQSRGAKSYGGDPSQQTGPKVQTDYYQINKITSAKSKSNI